MTPDLSKLIAGLSPQKRELLASLLKPASEPIAIIGLGCRLPGGVRTPGELWRLLIEGRDGVIEVPKDRWDADAYYDPQPGTPGKTNSRWGGFVEEIPLFDHRFFELSPREAICMDPQQRTFLEVAWEALENAGQTKELLSGSRAGVFVGVIGNEYGWHQFSDPERIDIHAGTGISTSVVSGRLSYYLNLRGPSVSVDTACSSSLTAVHLACQSLLARECDLAIAGGVNAILSPLASIMDSQMGIMAADGRCKAFDARGDGITRGEGSGVIVLKRLADALAAGDRIWACIRGTAANQDGRSVGLTAPNARAQEDVIRRALKAGNVAAADVGYVEAHGTGTPLGDPIEAEALIATYGANAGDSPRCLVGSVKTNFGHLEAAAGVVGLIKAVLAVHHGRVPPNLHFRTLNPAIRFEGTRMGVAADASPWPEGHRQRIAACSSFGWSGTNAHVVVQAPPAGERGDTRPPAPECFILPLSAQTPASLEATLRSFSGFLAETQPTPEHLAAICATAAHRRTNHDYRAAVVGASAEVLRRRLEALVSDPGDRAAAPERRLDGGKLAFVFSGTGSRYVGMGRRLLRSSATFREAVERCDAELGKHLGWSVLQRLREDDTTASIDRVEAVQPLLFAVHVGLDALWRSWGFVPDAVLGHSVGEVAAAHASGALSLEQAARVVCCRSRHLSRLRGQGKMLVVALGAEAVEALLPPFDGRLGIAAVNAAESTIVAGDEDAVDRLAAQLAAREVFCAAVDVDVPSHCALVDPILDDLKAELGDLVPRPAAIPMISSVTARTVDPAALGAAYWAANLRRPVMFRDAITLLANAGHRAFVELSHHPILTHPISSELRRQGVRAVVVPSLKRDEDDMASLLDGVGGLFAAGVPVDWRRLLPARPVVDLPRYSWDHERFWHESEPANRTPNGARAGRPHGSALLGQPIRPAHLEDTALFELSLAASCPAYLDEHRLAGVPILPGAAVCELALRGAAMALGSARYRLEALELRRPLFVPDGDAIEAQLVFDRTGAKAGRFRLYSRPANGAASLWLLHAEGAVTGEDDAAALPRWPERFLEDVRARAGHVDSGETYYRALALRDMHFGPIFQGIQRLWRRPGEALGALRLPDRVRAEAHQYVVHPALLDASFQVFGAAVEIEDPESPDHVDGTHFVMARVDSLSVCEKVDTEELYAHVILERGDAALGDTLRGDLVVADAAGNPSLAARGVHFVRLGRAVAEEARAHQRVSRDVGADATLDALLALPPPERAEGVTRYVRGRTAAILRVHPDDLDAGIAMTRLGLESMMAVELVKRIQADVRLKVPVVKVLQGMTVSQLAGHLMMNLWSGAEASQPTEAR